MRRLGVMRGTLLALAAAVGGLAPGMVFAVCGDANGDGRVTVSDGVATLRAAAGLSSQCDDDCDVDGSGAITVSDGVNVLRKAAGVVIDEQCPEESDPVASLIGHTVDTFGPLTKIGALDVPVPAGTISPCDNPDGGFQQTSDGFIFDDCDIDDVNLTGFLGNPDGQLDFDGLVVRRRGDALTLGGLLSLGQSDGNAQLNGVLNGTSQQLGSYVITFQGVVSDPQGATLDGILDFDTSESDIPDVAQVTVTLTGGDALPVVVRFDDDSTQNFTYDPDTDELTPVDGPVPTPTATPPAARVRLSNIDDRITAFLNGKQVLQAQSTGPGATGDTGFQNVDGLQCGDNVFEFRVENTVPASGYAFRVQLEVGGAFVVERQCGIAGFEGCNGNNQTQGEVEKDVTFFCVPCGPCTAGAGTCATPLQIPGTGRIQIHGQVRGANNLSGPCAGGGGPESVFLFTPSATGCYQFGTCGTSFDSQLSLGDGFCGGGGPIIEQCIDDNQSCAGGGTQEFQFGFFDAGVPITLLLDSVGSLGGSYTLDVRP